MTPQERDLVMRRVTGAWPRPKLEDEQIVVWMEHLASKDFRTSRKAFDLLERTKTHRPSISEFYEAYAASQPHPAEQAMPALEEAPMTAEERAFNKEQVQKLNAVLIAQRHKITKPIGMTKREPKQ